jgi:hypothetical protein
MAFIGALVSSALARWAYSEDHSRSQWLARLVDATEPLKYPRSSKAPFTLTRHNPTDYTLPSFLKRFPIARVRCQKVKTLHYVLPAKSFWCEAGYLQCPEEVRRLEAGWRGYPSR